jgi:hypothetical protein
MCLQISKLGELFVGTWSFDHLQDIESDSLGKRSTFSDNHGISKSDVSVIIAGRVE